jgi:uncharacterized protein
LTKKIKGITSNPLGMPMKRLIDYHLLDWKDDKHRKPLLLRGARQVGKTHAVQELGRSSFPTFVEVNLELFKEAHVIFEKDLHPERIVRDLSLITHQHIIPGQTLLFLDEIQAVPQALLALRYFYELMPELHVIAAGSLLDFAIEKVGIPVGRVQSLYMYPLSFMEFLAATGNTLIIEEILSRTVEKPMSDAVHNKLIMLLGEYLALGGMPEVIAYWQEEKDALRSAKVHQTLLNTYRQDFGKYARKLQIKYVELMFDQVPVQLGRKFKYSSIEGDYRKRELSPALDLLVTAGIVHKVFYSSGQGIPLGAQVDPQDYKAIFLDVGLTQAILDLDIAAWFLQPSVEFINKGALAEAFVGQELLAYSDPIKRDNLYYWHRETRASQAEIDYLIQQEQRQVIPVEVKSGMGSTLKSLHLFLETHASCPYGIRLSTQNYSRYEKIYSYPLYALAQLIGSQNMSVLRSIEALL